VIRTGDRGFYDGERFAKLEELGVGYVIGGRMEEKIDELTGEFPDKEWETVQKEEEAEYEAFEFAYGCEGWEKPRRMILSRRVHSGGQVQLDFARRRNVYVTNLGIDEASTAGLEWIEKNELEETGQVLQLAHGRGEQERTHKCLKEFGTEKLPMIDFHPNSVYVNIMVRPFHLYEAFKADALPEEVLTERCMPDTFRRKLMDGAGTVVETGQYIYLNVTEAVYDRLKLDEIWSTPNAPPVPSLI